MFISYLIEMSSNESGAQCEARTPLMPKALNSINFFHAHWIYLYTVGGVILVSSSGLALSFHQEHPEKALISSALLVVMQCCSYFTYRNGMIKSGYLIYAWPKSFVRIH